MRLYKTLITGAFLFLLGAVSSFGITFDLNCVLSNNACTAFPASFGTVKITDISGGVNVTVDTAAGGKFKDLFLNLNINPGTLSTPALYSSNSFQLNPYNGLFDIGSQTSPSKGIDGPDGYSFAILGSVTAANFLALDSLGLVNVAVHLQEIDCTSQSCVSGGGSIKVGGTYVPGGNNDVPEPATYLIAGGTLISMYLLRRKNA
ncbi:MAG TPA: hypothetical protein VFQ91_07705 [Bryobacteraceae bacterium]|nr:hypothetical protein [Bryobacteraceae bacterium]